MKRNKYVIVIEDLVTYELYGDSPKKVLEKLLKDLNTSADIVKTSYFQKNVANSLGVLVKSKDRSNYYVLHNIEKNRIKNALIIKVIFCIAGEEYVYYFKSKIHTYELELYLEASLNISDAKFSSERNKIKYLCENFGYSEITANKIYSEFKNLSVDCITAFEEMISYLVKSHKIEKINKASKLDDTILIQHT